MSSSFFQGPPGITAATIANFRAVFTRGFEQFLAQGRYIDGTKSRDPSNTTDVGVLQAGLLMGKITSSGYYAPSFYGLTGGSLAGSATSLTLGSTAVGTEIVRRRGSTGTFKIIGPPTAGGTVRTLTATYSAISAGVATITALGASAVWTLTAAAGTDGGSYRLKVTTPDGVWAITSNLAWNANSATVDAALEALSNVGASGVTAVYDGGAETLTLTFASNLGAVKVEVVSDTTNDGGVFEGGWTAVNTTAGVDGRFVTSSLLAPIDGSETPLTLISDRSAGIKVTDDAGNSVSVVDFAHFPVAGEIDSAQIINYPSDTSLRTWLQQQLSNGSGGKFTFAGSGGVF